MILKHITILIIGCCILFNAGGLTAQNRYSQDVEIFKTLVEKYHPSLYDYTPKPQFDSLINKAVKKSETFKNHYDLIISIARIVEKIGCGHTSISPSPMFMDEIAKNKQFFPFPIKILNQKIYALDNYYGIGRGKEILAINGVSSQEIVQKLYDILSSDGRTFIGKNGDLDQSFAVYFHFMYPNYNWFRIKIENNSDEIEVKGIDLEKALERSSDAIIKYKQNGITDAFYFNMLNDNTGYLAVNTFYFPEEHQQEFMASIKQIFTSLSEEKIPNLIIDVRNNSGGLRELAIYLYSFLSDKPFRQRTLTRIKTSDITSQYVSADKREVREISEWLHERFGVANKSEVDHLQDLMKPQDIQYKGKVYVITGNSTFSAGGEFVLNCKNNPDITLVGQETGAAYRFHNGDYSFNFMLPYSKTQITIPSTHIVHHVTKEHQKQTPIYPDYYVPLTIDDYVNLNDASMKQVTQLISKD